MMLENAKKYTAIICAAGQGKRLAQFTQDIPKPLVQVGERSVLAHMLDNFSACGLTEVVIVVGYKGEMIEREIGNKHGECAVSYIYNKDFEITDNLYSVYLAKEKAKNGMIFFNADIIFNRNILIKLIGDSHSNSLVTDSIHSEGSGKNPVRVKIDEAGLIRDAGHDIGEQYEEMVFGIYKLSSEATRRYFEIADDFFKDGPRKGGFWWPIKQMVAEAPFYSLPSAPHKWVSINNNEEYNKAVQQIDLILI